jgi:hypothetical protein
MSLQKTKKKVLYTFATLFTIALTYLGVQSDKEHTLTDTFIDDMNLMVKTAHADHSGSEPSPDGDQGGNGEGGPDSGGAY